MKNRKNLLIIALLVIVIATVVTYIVSHNSGTSTEEEIIKTVQKESNKVKEDLGKHIIFPEGDEPDIRKITQPINDPFFTKAQIGDYLVIFYKSRIAYLYSPSRNIIVNAGVVFANIADGLKSATSTATSTKTR